MKQTIRLSFGDSVEIRGNGLVLSLRLGEDDSISSQIGSEEGSGRILIRQDKRDHRILRFSQDKEREKKAW